MIKIAVVGTRGFPDVQGGIETHCEQLYTHLSEKGCDIIVYTRRPYVDPALKDFKGVRLIPLNCPSNKFIETIIHTFKGVIAAYKLKPDILHLHAIGPSLFAPFAKMLGMKVVVTSHGPEYKRKKWGLPARLFLKFCERMGIMFADEVITIARNISVDIKKKYGRDSTVIPNGVNIPQLAETEKYIGQYGLIKQRYILAVGRFVPEKGFHDLIDAFVQAECDNWKLVIIGDADHEDRYSKDLKITAGKYNNIILTGFLKGQPLHELYTHAGLFVLPSYYEGLPIVLLEAMSYRLSCVVSDIPANRNVELDEDRFFKTGDVALLREQIEKYINEPWGEEAIRDQIDLICTNYNWSIVAEETLKVYKKTVT